MAEKYDLRCQDLSRIIESLKKAMQSITDQTYNTTPSGTELIITETHLQNDDDASTPSGPAVVGHSQNNVPVISEVNMVSYLGNLEKKVNFLLNNYRNLQSSLTSHGQNHLLTMDNAHMMNVLGHGPKLPMGMEHLHVQPPKSEDYNNDDDDDDDGLPTGHMTGQANGLNDDGDNIRPMTREELKNRTINRLQKRLIGLGATGGAGNGNSEAGINSPAGNGSGNMMMSGGGGGMNGSRKTTNANKVPMHK
jgi:regulator of replication initiation timing